MLKIDFLAKLCDVCYNEQITASEKHLLLGKMYAFLIILQCTFVSQRAQSL
jgi:hypothetical protein